MSVTAPTAVENELKMSTAISNLETLKDLPVKCYLEVRPATCELVHDRNWWFYASSLTDVVKVVDQTFKMTMGIDDPRIRGLVADAFLKLTRLIETYSNFGDEARIAFENIEKRVKPYAQATLDERYQRVLNGKSSKPLKVIQRSASCYSLRDNQVNVIVNTLHSTLRQKKHLSAKMQKLQKVLEDFQQKDGQVKEDARLRQEKSRLELSIQEALHDLKKTEARDEAAPKKRGCDLPGSNQIMHATREEIVNQKRGLKRVNPSRKVSDSAELISTLEKALESIRLAVGSDDSGSDSDDDWDSDQELDDLLCFEYFSDGEISEGAIEEE